MRMHQVRQAADGVPGRPLQGDRIAGENVCRAGLGLLRLPERDRVMTLAYTNRDATYLKRFTFGGTILNKEYFCIPPKSKILFFEPDTPPELFIRYKPAPYQKINQQTCNPAKWKSKGRRRGGGRFRSRKWPRSTANRREAGTRKRRRRSWSSFDDL